jgi:hypothetical protein
MSSIVRVLGIGDLVIKGPRYEVATARVVVLTVLITF